MTSAIKNRGGQEYKKDLPLFILEAMHCAENTPKLIRSSFRQNNFRRNFQCEKTYRPKSIA